MRVLLAIALLAALAVAAGCSSNNPNSLMGSTDPSVTATNLAARSADQPSALDVTAAVYGTTSNVNLAAGTFTVTTAGDSVYNITLTPTTKVLYLGTTTDLSTSKLVDGLTVTVTGSPIGLPDQAKVRAAMVIINRSENNQGIIDGNQ